jgi:hypothetical protein
MDRTVKSLIACLAFALPTTVIAQPLTPEPEETPAPPLESAPAPIPAAAPMPAAAPAPQVVYLQAAPEQKFAKNVLYAEIAGNAGFYSINYEHFLRPDAAIRAGFMYMSMSATAGSSSAKVTWAAVPVMFEYFGVHSGSHALELGLGLSMNYLSGMSTSDGATAGAEGITPIGTATIGYRYSNPTGGFVFKAGYTPLIAISAPENAGPDYSRVFHWGGMSFGYRF